MKLKILHLIDSGGLYGAEKMLLTLVSEQLKLGLEPMILSVGAPGISEKPLEIEARRLGLPVRTWRMNPGLNLLQARKVIRWAQDQNYDLMHSHGYKFNILAGIWPKRLRRLPLVSTLHGYVHAKPFTKMWFYETLDRIVLPQLSAIILVSEAMRDEVTRIAFLKRKIRIIPNGIDLNEIQNKASDIADVSFSAFLKDHRPLILGVGRLSTEKGFDRLIKALGELKKNYPHAGLLIVGEGKLRQELTELAETEGVADSVLMPGYYDNVPALMTHADALAMPSTTEGLPMTVLEAMAMQLPVAASSVGEIPEVLGQGEGGWLFRSRLPPEISQTLLSIIDLPTKRNRKTAWSYMKVVEDYSASTMASKYSETYRSVLE